MTQTVLTSTGFARKYYGDFIADMETLARQLFGSDVNLSDQSPLGKFVKLIAYARAEENELSEAVYLSAYVDYAEGTSLDRVAKYIGATRIAAAYASGTAAGGNAAQLTIDAGVTVPAGTIVATTGNVQFATLADITNSGAVTAAFSADIQALLTGPFGNVPANTITVIKTPVAGLQSVNNPQALLGGRDAETDNEFRQRYKDSVAKGGASTVDSIRAKLLETNGVRAAVVIENDQDIADVDGRPPHCFECVVLGGTDADIGQAILDSKAGGIQAYGSTSVTVNDMSGNPKTIGFSYATQRNIWITMNLTKNAGFPVDGSRQAQDAAVKYIGGTDLDGNIFTGLGMGDDVIFGQLVKGAFLIPGVDNATITVSTDGVTFVSTDVAIGTTEVAQTDAAKVVVNVA